MKQQTHPVKTDCYAYLYNNGRPACDALVELNCRYCNCSFYTPKDVHEETARKANERNAQIFPKGYKPRNLPRGD